MSLQYSPKIITDSLVMCLDPSQNKSYPTTDLPVKGGLVMWMDAADDTTFSYSSGTTVSQWRDKSGFNYHMVPVSAGPTRNAFLNSRKVLAFTNTQDIQNLSIDLRTSAYSVFVVDRYTSPSSGTGRILTSNSGLNNWLLGHWASEVNKYYANGWIYSTYVALDTNWKLYLGDWGGPSNDLANFYGAGTAIATNSADAAAGPWGLGINANSGERSNCEAAEIIVFNRLLTATERKQVHTYLGQKWGISNTDRSIVDLSNNNNHGLLGNGTVANMPEYDYYNKGALSFSQSLNDTVLTPLPITATPALSNFTYEVWTKLNRFPPIVSPPNVYGVTYRAGFLFGASYYSGAGLLWYGYPTGDAFSLYAFIRGNDAYRSTNGYPFALNQYYHCVMVNNYGANKLQLYINGTLYHEVDAATQEYNSSLASDAGNIGISKAQVDGGGTANYSHYDGIVAVARIYNKALSATEISQNYEAQKSKFANTIVQQGLVLNLDAGNIYSYAGAGTTWYDVSGNSFNATLINSPTYSSDNGGVINWASASSQYATVPMSSTLRVASITEEVWVYLSTTADQVFIGSQYGTSSNNSFALWVSGGTFYFGVNTGGTFYNTSSSSASAGTWYHLVHTYNGTTQYLYINGVLATTYNSAASGNVTYDTSNTLLAIGADFNGTGYNTGPTLFVNGKMPIVKIYNIALSAAQVLQNYNATKGRFGL